jgi:hypothetical protein
MSIVSGDRRGPSRANSILTDGVISNHLCAFLIVEGSLLVFTERHMHGLDRCATVSSVSPYSSGDCRRCQCRPVLDSYKAAVITIILHVMKG